MLIVESKQSENSVKEDCEVARSQSVIYFQSILSKCIRYNLTPFVYHFFVALALFLFCFFDQIHIQIHLQLD